MTRDEILKDPGYLRLTVQQKLFVDAMIDNGGDKVEAAADAYKCKDRYSAVTMASKLMRNPVIGRLLVGITMRPPTKEELAAEAWKRGLTTKDDIAAHKWLTLAAHVLKYDKEEEDPSKKYRENKATEEARRELVADLEKRGL